MEKWYEPMEADWVLLNTRLPQWQEKYIGGLLESYRQILDEEKNGSEKFWELEKRLSADSRLSAVRVTELRRTKILEIIVALISEKVISMEDLEDFSPELRETLVFILERMNSTPAVEEEETEAAQ